MGTSCERISSYSFVQIILKLCAYVFVLWGCACGLDIIVRSLFVTFFHIVNFVIFHPLFINIWYSCERNSSDSFALIVMKLCMRFFSSVWGCACGLHIIVRSFFFSLFFPHCELSHSSSSIYRQWVSHEHNTSYNFILFLSFFFFFFFFFWNFAHVFSQVCGSARGLDMIFLVHFCPFSHLSFYERVQTRGTRRVINCTYFCLFVCWSLHLCCFGWSLHSRCLFFWWCLGEEVLRHYENTPIQIYWKFYYQKMKIFR